MKTYELPTTLDELTDPKIDSSIDLTDTILHQGVLYAKIYWYSDVGKLSSYTPLILEPNGVLKGICIEEIEKETNQ